MAKLQEDKLNDARRPSQFRPPATSLAISPIASALPAPPPLLPTPPQTIFKKLTAVEMAARREKGLCYNCDAHYSPNHKCQTKFFLLIASDDVAPDDPVPPDLVPILSEDYTATPSDDHFLAQLSLHAMADHLASTMFRVNGCINGTEVIILVDGGSTHNFIHDRLARCLRLKA